VLRNERLLSYCHPLKKALKLARYQILSQQKSDIRLSNTLTMHQAKSYPKNQAMIQTSTSMPFQILGLPRFGGQASGLHGCECTGVDGHLLVVDRAEVANR